MQAVSGSVCPNEISTLGRLSCRVVTSQSAYLPPIYYIRIHRQIQDDTTKIHMAYAGRNLVVKNYVLFLSARRSVLSIQPGKDHVWCWMTLVIL